jgi:hypothetical protein
MTPNASTDDDYVKRIRRVIFIFHQVIDLFIVSPV